MESSFPKIAQNGKTTVIFYFFFSILQGVKVVKYNEKSPHVDLAILGRADHYIGNCVSTFSAFAGRERLVNEKPSSFWAFKEQNHDEL